MQIRSKRSLLFGFSTVFHQIKELNRTSWKYQNILIPIDQVRAFGYVLFQYFSKANQKVSLYQFNTFSVVVSTWAGSSQLLPLFSESMFSVEKPTSMITSFQQRGRQVYF